jgi:hypothetical protein
MMKATIDGADYNVYQASFEATKPVDRNGVVAGAINQQSARFVIEATPESSKLTEKFVSRQPFDMELEAQKLAGEGVHTKVKFKECAITYFMSNYDSSSESPYTITISVNAREITHDSASLVMNRQSAV